MDVVSGFAPCVVPIESISGRAVGVAIAFGVVSHATGQPMISLDAPMVLLILVAIAPLVGNIITNRSRKRV